MAMYTSEKERIPYRRVLTNRGVLYDQTGRSLDQQQKALVKEGFTVIESGPNGRLLKVDHYRDYNFDFSDLKIVMKENTLKDARNILPSR